MKSGRPFLVSIILVNSLSDLGNRSEHVVRVGLDIPEFEAHRHVRIEALLFLFNNSREPLSQWYRIIQGTLTSHTLDIL